MKREVSLIVWIVLFSFLIRFVFILRVPPPAITIWGDDGYYQLTGFQIADYLRQSGALLKEGLSGNLFHGRGVLEKYGLEIPWGAFKRGPGYPFFLGLIFWIGGAQVLPVFIIQALLVSFSGGLIYGIAKGMGEKDAGLLGAILLGLYPPATFITSRIYQESLTLFLFCLFYFLGFRCWRRPSTPLCLMAGFALCLLALTRSSLCYFPLFWLLMLVLLKGIPALKQWGKGTLVAFGLSFAIPLLIWMSLIYLQSGRFGPLVFQAGGDAMFPALLRDFEGWRPDGFSLERPTPEVVELLEREGVQVPQTEGLFGWPPDSEVAKAAFKVILRSPQSFLKLALHKFRLLWWQPYDWPWRSFLFDPDPLRWFHRSLMIAAVMGGMLWVFERPVGVSLLFAAPLYGSLFHSLSHIESRYPLIFVPFLMLFAGYGLSFLWRHRARLLHSSSRMMICSGSIFLTLIVFYGIRVESLLSLFPSWGASTSHFITVILKTFFLILVFFSGALWLETILPRKRLVALVLVTGLIILVPFEVYGLSAVDWAEWSTPLRNPGELIRQEIFLPGGSLKNSIRENLRMDLELPGADSDGWIQINGRPVAPLEKLKAERPKFAFESYLVFLKDERKNVSDMRQWFTLPLPKGTLREEGMNTIEIHSKGGKVYGDYPVSSPSSGRIVYGPLFQRSFLETSIFKYIYDGDFRLKGTVSVHSKEVRSAFYDGSRWHTEDLSRSAGIQTGQYRIRIEVEGPEGKFWVY